MLNVIDVDDQNQAMTYSYCQLPGTISHEIQGAAHKPNGV